MAPSVLVACFHVEVGEQRVVSVTQLGESIGTVAHEVVRLLVKSVIMRVTRHQAGLWKEEREVRHRPASAHLKWEAILWTEITDTLWVPPSFLAAWNRPWISSFSLYSITVNFLHFSSS